MANSLTHMACRWIARRFPIGVRWIRACPSRNRATRAGPDL